MSEVELVGEVVDRRPVDAEPRGASRGNRVREVVAAAVRDRRQAPVLLDELQDGHVVGVVVRDVTARRVRRDRDERDARAVAEEVERLHVAGVPVAAALVERDEDGGVLPELGLRLDRVDDLLGVALEEVELRRGRVAVEQTARLGDREGGEPAVRDVRVEIGQVLQVVVRAPRWS
jgi:hypothetical protein